MATVEEFRAQLSSCATQELVEQFLLTGECLHVSIEVRTAISSRLCERFRVSTDDMKLHIVGSAKLGFSLVEKRQRDAPTLPRYRSFGPNSDIDVAIIHEGIFTLIWQELSEYAHCQPFWPWRAQRLGDYLVCGWIRPDHFPKNVRLLWCDEWWDTISALSNELFDGRRKVRAGLFQSDFHLKKYYSRAIEECKLAEDIANENCTHQ